jgi:hypothetical protein
MVEGFLIIWLVTGQPLYFKYNNGDCHRSFEKLTHTKTVTTPQKRIKTFYMGTEVLAYRCFDYDTARFEK